MRFTLWSRFLILFDVIAIRSCYSSIPKEVDESPEDDFRQDDTTPIRHHQRFRKLEKIMCEKLGCDEHADDLRRSRKSPEKHDMFTKNNAIVDTISASSNSRNIWPPHQWNDLHNRPKRKEDPAPMTRVDPQPTERIIVVESFNARTLSPASDSKMKELGSPQKVNEKFQKLYGSRADADRALEHYRKMLIETKCSEPKPTLVKVNDIYPDPHKQYYPSCTLIHKCNEQSGCCPETKTCATSKAENVTLYFKVSIKVPDYRRQVYQIEALTFVNDTKCKCSSLDEKMQLDATYELTEYEKSMKSNDVPLKKCNCPAPFSVRTRTNGSCSCDCFDKEAKCLKYKKGEEYFDYAQKNCIDNHKCSEPMCEYGVYSNKLGRCPKNYYQLN